MEDEVEGEGMGCGWSQGRVQEGEEGPSAAEVEQEQAEEGVDDEGLQANDKVERGRMEARVQRSIQATVERSEGVWGARTRAKEGGQAAEKADQAEHQHFGFVESRKRGQRLAPRTNLGRGR